MPEASVEFQLPRAGANSSNVRRKKMCASIISVQAARIRQNKRLFQ